MIMNYDSVPNKDEILILGGGQSIYLNKQWIAKFAKKHNPIVLGAHYEHISTDYIYFNLIKHLEQELNNFKCRNIVIPMSMKSSVKNRVLRKFNKKLFLTNFDVKSKDKYGYVGIDKIKVKSNGKICHSITNVGFTAILTSIFFKPKRITLVGFDGPVRNENGNYLYYTRWNRQINIMHPVDKHIKRERKREERYWEMLLEFVKSKGIEICTVRTDLLRGVNRVKMGVKIL
jgi:hypothetical protein